MDGALSGAFGPEPAIESAMLHWIVTFLLLALVAAGLAFGGTGESESGQWMRALVALFLTLAGGFWWWQRHRPDPPSSRS